MAKPPHTGGKMRVFYPICQIAELAARYRYTTARRRVPQSETVAYPVRGVCQPAGHGGATWAVPRQLLDLSAPQSDQSGADGAEARAPHGQRVWSADRAGDGHNNCEALSRSWVSDESAEKASEYLSTLARGNRSMTRAFA